MTGLPTCDVRGCGRNAAMPVPRADSGGDGGDVWVCAAHMVYLAFGAAPGPRPGDGRDGREEAP